MTLQPAARVEPVAGGAQATPMEVWAPTTIDDVWELARPRGVSPRLEDEARPLLHRTTRDGLDAIAALEVRLRGIDRRDDDARGRPGVLIERDPPPSEGVVRRSPTYSSAPTQGRPKQQPRRQPASPDQCVQRISAVPGSTPRRSRRHSLHVPGQPRPATCRWSATGSGPDHRTLSGPS